MTRGRIVIIKQDYAKHNHVQTSIEFNGDMALPTKTWKAYGNDVIKALRQVNDGVTFLYQVAKFNNSHHRYDEESLTYEVSIDTLDFTNDYFGNWFSDYIYIKNITEKPVSIIVRKEGDDKGENYQLSPNKIAVLYFGRLVKVVD